MQREIKNKSDDEDGDITFAQKIKNRAPLFLTFILIGENTLFFQNYRSRGTNFVLNDWLQVVYCWASRNYFRFYTNCDERKPKIHYDCDELQVLRIEMYTFSVIIITNCYISMSESARIVISSFFFRFFVRG